MGGTEVTYLRCFFGTCPVACCITENAVWLKSGRALRLAGFLVFFAMPHDGIGRTGKKLKLKLTHYRKMACRDVCGKGSLELQMRASLAQW